MKKFLSLVLALVMTMSLVTISAGATEYKDFTDKDEIQYEEAVTVLNKLGIITGYSEGDFRPEGELTRGAAAKILVSLLIGPDAANALGNESSPYPDVPAGNTFAGVISYCKTAKIINGYGDGTFRPTGTLTGYAFAKMLLGALGYNTQYEGFTGAGWNMNVARLGGEAGLFDRISFNGNATVTREQACQLALNTLKGTMVEYSGGMNITAGDASIVANPDRNYKTSNQEFAQHINNRKAGDQQLSGETWYTVEFGEEHFVDLRMEREQTNADSFGRPSNVWSWKKVTIGTFPIEPDYVFTAQTAHLDKSDSEKNRATGLGGFKVTRTASAQDDILDGQTATRVWINGRLEELSTSHPAYSVSKPAEISDLTDNGTVVEVYVSDLVADFITDVVVMKTQLMEVRRVGSDYVALQRQDNKAPDKPVNNAYNQPVMDVSVEDVQAEDDLYSVVSGLKAGDLVAVVPVAQDADKTATTKWDVGDAYVPETVTGALSAVETYGAYSSSAKDPVNVTVGGTKYNIALWSRDLLDIDGDAVKVTRKDVTLYLDRNGNAMKINDAGSVSGWFIIGRYYQTLVENRIVTMVEGWDTSGEKMELNLGTSEGVKASVNYMPGDLVRYVSTTSNSADWVLTQNQADGDKNQVVALVDRTVTAATDGIKSSDVQVPVVDYAGNTSPEHKENVYTDKGVKFVYVTFDPNDNEVESISIKNGVQEVKDGEMGSYKGSASYQPAQVGYTTVKNGADPDAVKVVVIKQEANDATASNLLYIRDQIGGAVKQSDGSMVYCYTVAMLGTDGLVNDNMTIYSDDKMAVDTFAAYSQKENENYSEFYDLREHDNFTGRTTSTFEASLGSFVTSNGANVRILNPEFVKGTGVAKVMDGTQKYNGDFVQEPVVFSDPRRPGVENGGESRHIRISSDTVFVDLRTKDDKDATGGRTISSRDDFKWVFENYLDKGNGLTGKDKVNDWLLDKAGDITFLMQLVINDNSSNNSFRTVSMVVITDQLTLGSANAPVSKYGDDGNTSSGGEEDPDTYTVESKTTGVNELEFAVVATSATENPPTVPTTAVDAAKLTWGATAKAKEGDTVLVRAKNGSKITTLNAADMFKTGTYDQATLGNSNAAPADIGASTGIYKFVMGTENVTINRVTTDTPVAEAITIDGTNQKVNVKLTSGSFAATPAGDNAKLAFVADYITNNVTGCTAKVDVPFGGGDGTGLKITDGNGTTITVTKSNVKAATDLLTATVDEETVVFDANTGATLGGYLTLAGITVENASANIYVKKDVSGTVAAVATDSTGLADSITDGTVIDTNDGKGYIKLNATPVTTSVALTSNAVTAPLFTSVTAGLEYGNNGFEDSASSNAICVKVGADLTITLTAGKDGKIPAGYDVKAVIAVAGGDATVDGPYKVATAVPELAHGSDWKVATPVELTFKLTAATAAQVGALTVTLNEVAVP